MPISYRIEPAGYVVDAWAGVVTIDDVRRHWQALLRDPQAMALRRSLADLSQADLRLSEDELAHAVHEVIQPGLAGGTWTCAIVVRSVEQMRLTRLFRSLSTAMISNMAFSSRDEAVRWLLRQP